MTEDKNLTTDQDPDTDTDRIEWNRYYVHNQAAKWSKEQIKDLQNQATAMLAVYQADNRVHKLALKALALCRYLSNIRYRLARGLDIQLEHGRPREDAGEGGFVYTRHEAAGQVAG